MKTRYDVAVIGAGPIGSYTAYQLVDKGFDVCLIDAKQHIGRNVVCTGIISKEAFRRYDLPSECILSRIDSFVFISPHGQRLEYIHSDVFAYVVSREIFDKALLALAQKCGADVHLHQQIIALEHVSQHYRLQSKDKKYRARAVVLATGVNYGLHTSLGLSTPPGFLSGAQVVLPSLSPNQLSRIEIHIGRNFAPGSFGWAVPISSGQSRFGVIIEKEAKVGLKRMLKERMHFSPARFEKMKIKQKPIAYGPIERSVRDKILAVGEAAGQVKTTTGGGIFYGLLCSEIAVDKLQRTLKSGYSLRDYEVTWRTALVPELDIGRRMRESAQSLSDDTVEKLFKFVKHHKFWVELLLPRINFDYHSNFLFYCLKSFESFLKK
jgi:digeranylgeranylglycerophospholipid reductase